MDTLCRKATGSRALAVQDPLDRSGEQQVFHHYTQEQVHHQSDTNTSNQRQLHR